jgi:hypothetical protein
LVTALVRESPTRATLRALTNGLPISAISHLEDPCENATTEVVAFFGGAYVVFPGILDDIVFSTEAVLQTVLTPGLRSELSRDALKRIINLVGCTLSLSDLVASRAGLIRYTQPSATTGADVFIPPTDRLSTLIRAVRIPRQVVVDEIERRGFDIAYLDEIVAHPGNLTTSDVANPESDELCKRPIAWMKDDLVVLSPGSLLGAIRYHVVRFLHEQGKHPALARCFNRKVADIAKASLRNFGLGRIELALSAGPQHISEEFFKLDNGKILHLQVLTDDMKGYEPDQLFGTWDAATLLKEAARRRLEVENAISQLDTRITEILHLIVYEPLGRNVFLGLEDDGLLAILLPAADLQDISILESSDPLFLLKYARASRQLRKRTEVLCFDPMNEIGFFRRYGNSYYASDEAPPTMLHIGQGFKGDVHRELGRTRDPHPVEWGGSRSIVSVSRLNHDMDVPIYMPFPVVGTAPEFLVESDITAWVRTEAQDGQPFSKVWGLGEALAFWLWQFGSRLAEAGVQDRVILVNTSFALDKVSSEPVDVEVSTHGKFVVVDVVVGTDFELGLAVADNRAERDLLVKLLGAVLTVVNPEVRRDITSWVDAIAPLGPKRIMAAFSIERRPQLDRGDLPKPRQVQDADLSAIDDHFSDWVAHPFGLGQGPISESQQTKVTNLFVDACLAQLRTKLQAFDFADLADYLIPASEALLHERVLFDATLGSKIACYGDHKDFGASMAKNAHKARGSEVALRFLIELVAAEPPKGDREMSLSDFDELLALSYSILNRGLESDLIHFSIADFKLRVLASGRLGANRTEYKSGTAEYLQESASFDLIRGRDAYSEHWKPTDGDGVDKEMEAAFNAEFGLSATELVEMFWSIYRFGQEVDAESRHAIPDDLVRFVAEDLKWSTTVAKSRLELLSLHPRDHLMAVPEGMSIQDVVPWRFNRSLSLLRRPLLWNEDRNMVLWGNRQLITSLEYWADLVVSGRLRAVSKPMKLLITKFRQAASEQFNNKVADFFGRDAQSIVLRRVKKIQGERIVDAAGNVLGDIDVLVCQPNERRILAVECKQFGGARTPAELSNELREVFVGPKSTAAKHDARGRWLRGNLAKVAGHLGVDAKKRWRVVSFVVVDRELLSPFLVESSVPVVPYLGLGSWLPHRTSP